MLSSFNQQTKANNHAEILIHFEVAEGELFTIEQGLYFIVDSADLILGYLYKPKLLSICRKYSTTLLRLTSLHLMTF